MTPTERAAMVARIRAVPGVVQAMPWSSPRPWCRARARPPAPWCAGVDPGRPARHADHRRQHQGRLAGRLRRGRGRRRRGAGRPEAGREPGRQRRRPDHHHLAHRRRHRLRRRADPQDLHRRRHLLCGHERVRPDLHLHAAGPGPAVLRPRRRPWTSSRSSSTIRTRRRRSRPRWPRAAGPGAVVTDWTEKNRAYFSALQVERNVMR